MTPEPFTLPGVFPDCGCHYTTADDGIHFCRMHNATPDLLAVLDRIIRRATAPMSNGDISFDDVAAARAAIAKATGR